MSKRLSIIIWTFSVCMCMPVCGAAAQPDPLALNSPVYEPIVNGRQVTIEVFFVNGQEACGNSIEEAVEAFDKYVAGKVRIAEPQNIRFENESLSRSQFEVICGARKFRQAPDIVLVIAPDMDFFKGRGEYGYEVGTDGQACNSVKINARTIERDAKRFGYTSLESFWSTIILHELCHSLGVPSERGHICSGTHCTNLQCILYPDFDAESLSVIRESGFPRELCSVCTAEVRAAQKKAKGKFYDLSVPYDMFQRIAEANPDNPDAQVYTVFKSLHEKDYPKALANCTRLIELAPTKVLASVNDGMTAYGLRGMIYNNYLGDPRSAVADFTRALAINPSESGSALALRQILAARPDLNEHVRLVVASTQ